MILPKFPKNCMKLKEFGPPVVARVPHAPLDPPLSNRSKLITHPVGGVDVPADYLTTFFAENCMKMKERNWTQGVRVPSAPLGSATVDCILLLNIVMVCNAGLNTSV